MLACLTTFCSRLPDQAAINHILCTLYSDCLCLQVVHIDLPYKSQTPEVPSANNNYHRNLHREWRADLKPLNVEQPEGPSFEV